MPMVSVVMPVFNASKFLKESIESILNQSYSDLEFIIFNDGSLDNSSDIIQRFKDPRIKFFDSQENRGYVVHLNHGIEMARGKYIARMDADDIAHPERLKQQVAFLETHPEIGVLGAWLQTLEAPPDFFKYPETHEEIMMVMINDNPMGHPVVMIRKQVLIDHNIRYDETYIINCGLFYQMLLNLRTCRRYYCITGSMKDR
jgi:glycosyltransferase involved in cell wall biosynthesis